MNADKKRKLLAAASERSISYLEHLESRPVFPENTAIADLESALNQPMPDQSSPAGDVLAFIDEKGSPATVASAGGRYFGFVTGGALPATVASNWLATSWDQSSFGFMSSPAVALFEAAALRWLKDVLKLPDRAEGTFVTGATMANFTGLAAARHHVLKQAGWDVERQGLFGAPQITVIVGAEVHATVLKVLAMLGLGRERIVTVPADDQGRMMADKIPDFEGPAILCLQAGNVNSGAFDPAGDIIPAARKRGAWIHVDGAFGLWAHASAKLAPLIAGFEGADSWATDAHKWLNVPYDCGVAFVRHAEALHQAMSITGAYLMLGERRDAIDVTPDSSRRARGLDVWAALKSLGRTGLAEMIERNCEQAKWIAGRLRENGVEILNDVVLNQVVAAFGDDAETEDTIRRLQQSGTCWCGATTWRGRRAMRISISSWATTGEDMETTLSAILVAYKALNR